jgi:hypothetical protein
MVISSLMPITGKTIYGRFDNNGTKDNILTRTVNGKDKPVFLKHDLESALPVLKKNNPSSTPSMQKNDSGSCTRSST